MDEIFQRLVIFKMVAYASMGGIVHYLYMYITDKHPWSWIRLLIYIFIAGYVGLIVSETVSDTFEYKEAIISICGMSSLEIIKIMEEVVKKNILFVLEKKFNLKSDLEQQDEHPPKKKPE